MFRRLVFLAFPLVAGCFAPDYGNGGFACSTDGRCPDGYLCAADQRCYKSGAAPDLGSGGGAAPAALWISGGGGAGQAASGAQLGVTIGGTDVAGVSTAASGASISFGTFSSTVQ